MIQSTLQTYELYEYLNNAEECVKLVFKHYPELKKSNTFMDINNILVQKYNYTKYNSPKGLITLDRASRKVRHEKNKEKEQQYREYYGKK